MSQTKAITVRIDETVKKHAEEMLEDIGMNMTTYIVLCLKALLRENKVPFELTTTQCLTDQIILEKLIEAEKEAGDPDAKWLGHGEVFGKLREKYGYKI
jgi:DNA-damage-inducible protein J